MSLRSEMQQNIQTELNFSSTSAGEAREAGREETESLSTTSDPESPASTNRLMEEVCERENLKEALRRVKANKGSAGVDGMTVGGITDYLKQHWPAIREQLLNGTYEPKPVRRVEIPKPDGGVRKLGIPTVLDRFIQQAVMQVLQRRWDPTFSEHSHGCRPKRSAHQAVAKAQQYIAAGHRGVVDAFSAHTPCNSAPLSHKIHILLTGSFLKEFHVSSHRRENYGCGRLRSSQNPHQRRLGKNGGHQR